MDNSKEPRVQLDPLRRVFIPIEFPTSTGHLVFRTTDKEAYQRDPVTGVIRRLRVKISKKQRRKNARS